MAIDKHILRYIENELSVKITDVKAVSGGSINKTYGLQTTGGKYFIKINNSARFPGMFKVEATGLNLIASTQTIAVPQIILEGQVSDEDFLLLEWIENKSADDVDSGALGKQLAEMHRNSADYFGLDHDNYMGSLTQSNKKHNTWSSFFINERLIPMVKMAVDKQLLEPGFANAFEALYKKLPDLFDEEKPSLIHGDLWTGNYLISANGKTYLIDPAVSYGHREFDIAMTTLFGGFSSEFYLGYNETSPLAKEWEGRLNLWNLYPLLVHLNLFGRSYLGQVMDSLKQYL